MSPYGFLSQGINTWISDYRTKYADWFQLVGDASTVAHKIMFKLRLHNKDVHEIMVGALFVRILATVQGVAILCERGMTAQAKMLVRCMMDSLFVLGAIADDPEFAVTFNLASEWERIRSYENWKRIDPSKRSPKLDPEMLAAYD